jgi:pimeloyl-ACP methyl ester carboxylesterase
MNRALPLRVPAFDHAAQCHARPAGRRLRGLLDRLDIAEVAVIGAPAVSTSALQFAIRHPHWVRALILVSPNVPGPHHKHSRIISAVAHTLSRFNVVF